MKHLNKVSMIREVISFTIFTDKINNRICDRLGILSLQGSPYILISSSIFYIGHR